MLRVRKRPSTTSTRRVGLHPPKKLKISRRARKEHQSTPERTLRMSQTQNCRRWSGRHPARGSISGGPISEQLSALRSQKLARRVFFGLRNHFLRESKVLRRLLLRRPELRPACFLSNGDLPAG